MPKKVSKEVVRAEDTRLRDYELVLVFSPEVADENLDSAIDKVNQFIVGRGGTISVVEQWGKRVLAYPIKHFMEGSYVLTRFKLRAALGKELEANLEISEEILRHLLIKLSD